MHVATWHMWGPRILRVAAEALADPPCNSLHRREPPKREAASSSLRASASALSAALKPPCVGFISPLPLPSLVTFFLLSTSPHLLQQAESGNCATGRQAGPLKGLKMDRGRVRALSIGGCGVFLGAFGFASFNPTSVQLQRSRGGKRASISDRARA